MIPETSRRREFARWALLIHRSRAYPPMILPVGRFIPGPPSEEGYRLAGLYPTKRAALAAKIRAFLDSPEPD